MTMYFNLPKLHQDSEDLRIFIILWLGKLVIAIVTQLLALKEHKPTAKLSTMTFSPGHYWKTIYVVNWKKPKTQFYYWLQVNNRNPFNKATAPIKPFWV